MSLTNPNTPISEQDLKDFYEKIKPYLGTNAAPSEDMAEIVSPLPSIPTRKIKYSTDEQVIGEWIDGKPVYEKTLTGTLSNGGELLIPFDLTINKVVSLDGIVDDRVPINIRIDADVYVYALGSLTSGGIYVKSGTSYYNCLVNIVVRYTKTTD